MNDPPRKPGTALWHRLSYDRLEVKAYNVKAWDDAWVKFETTPGHCITELRETETHKWYQQKRTAMRMLYKLQREMKGADNE